MPKINYLEEARSSHKLKRGGLFVIVFLVLAFLMGLLGGGAAIMLFSSNSKLQDVLGIKGSSINIATTKTEKIRLEESSAIIDTVKKVNPAVVSITTTANVQDFFGRSIEQQGGGTGFIVTSDGLIMTNKHVPEAGNTLTVLTSEGKTLDAKVVAKDPTNDLAILKVEASGLPVVDLGNSDDLQIGQWVVAVGNALGEFQNTVTVGVLSARERQLTASGNGQSEALNNLLQTDTAINPGNSGGPLCNLAGQVIGINTAVAGNAQNIGFAIPINQAKSALDSYKKSGKIIKPFLGVRYITLNKEIAKQRNIGVDYGAYLIGNNPQDAVVGDSPAAKVGLRSSDVILKINGEEINENHPLTTIISKYQPNDEIELTIFRDGKESQIKVKLGSTE